MGAGYYVHVVGEWLSIHHRTGSTITVLPAFYQYQYHTTLCESNYNASTVLHHERRTRRDVAEK